MRRKYISQAIKPETYALWLEGKKIILNAPTGTGKTTFILSEILPCCKRKGKKMLILCNRRLLRQQYNMELCEQYMRFAEMTEDVAVATYQQLAGRLCEGQNLEDFLAEYHVIVCDEAHYFYSDADFNALGTYVLLQALVKACFRKAMILITATPDEVKPLLERTFRQCYEKLRRERTDVQELEKYAYSDVIYDLGYWADFDRFHCRYVADVETLADQLAKSPKKSVIFIDDKAKAESFRKLLLKTGEIRENEIFLMNAQILEEQENSNVIQSLVVLQKVLPKILITTSVLDNGVSIHDAEVGNVVIATEAKVSFLQMLGRVRAEEVDQCLLYIYPRDARYYEKRVQQYAEKMKQFEKMKNVDALGNLFECLVTGWYGNDEKADFYRNAYALTLYEAEYYSKEWKQVYVTKGDFLLAVNEFAKEKVGNMLIAEKKFWKLALESPEKVAIEQIAWLGKSAEELEIIDSQYRIVREKSLVEELLSIQEFTVAELGSKKEKLAKEFRKDFFPDIVSKTGTFSTEKLERICERLNLELVSTQGEDKTKRYSVRKNGNKKEDANS